MDIVVNKKSHYQICEFTLKSTAKSFHSLMVKEIYQKKQPKTTEKNEVHITDIPGNHYYEYYSKHGYSKWLGL